MKKINIILYITLIGIIAGNTALLSDIKFAYGTKLIKTEYTETISVTGEFQNISETEIRLAYPVYIKEVFVKENDYVTKGQALFSLDTDKMSSAINGDIDYEILNQISYSDLEELSSVSAFSYIDIANIIYSPCDGIVSQINVYDNAFVMKNNSLMTLSPDSEIMAKFSVSQGDFGRIKVGDAVEVSSVAFPDTKYYGTISDTDAVVKKQVSITGQKVMVDVFAAIDNRDKKVSGGLQLNGRIQTGIPQEKNMLDYSYIHQDNNGEYVFLLDKGNAKKVYITTGTETPDSVEVLTEFNENDIFLYGDITDGDRVVIIGETDESV